MQGPGWVLVSLTLRSHKPTQHWLKIEMQIIIFSGSDKIFCPEIILSLNAVPPTFIQIPAPGISSLAKCPSMVSQIQQSHVSLSCHPASILLSTTTTTTQHGGNVSQLMHFPAAEWLFSWCKQFVWLMCDGRAIRRRRSAEAKWITRREVTNSDGPKLSSRCRPSFGI